MITVENLSFIYQGELILKDLSFSISSGEVVSFIGRSGSGKTTLLRLLASLEKPLRGKVQVLEPVSYMTQHPLLLPRRNLLENLMLLAELDRVSSRSYKEWQERALFFLREVGLYGYREHFPHELSGGMKSRASLARVLLEDKQVLLLDEPFASLDALTRVEMHHLVSSLQKKYQKTMVLVTHDIAEAVHLSSQIFLLSDASIQKFWDILPSTEHPTLIQEIMNDFLQKREGSPIISSLWKDG